MTTADRLHQAATKLRDAADAVDAHPKERVARVYPGPRVLMLRALGFDRTDIAHEFADWLDDIAADKASGLTTIHPRAAAIADLILGDQP